MRKEEVVEVDIEVVRVVIRGKNGGDGGARRRVRVKEVGPGSGWAPHGPGSSVIG